MTLRRLPPLSGPHLKVSQPQHQHNNMSEKTETVTAPAQRAGMTQNDFVELAGAVHRLNELQSLSILSKDTEAELRGLQAYLTTTVTKFAPELLGAWAAVHNEYEPIIRAFAVLTSRVKPFLVPQPVPTNEAAAK
jgi:hypothetical protein